MQSNLSWEKSLLVIYNILGQLVNALTADEKQYLLNRDNLMQPIQMQWSKKKLFPNFLLHFWNLDQSLNILKKKMTLKAYVFRRLRTAKDVLR